MLIVPPRHFEELIRTIALRINGMALHTRYVTGRELGALLCGLGMAVCHRGGVGGLRLHTVAAPTRGRTRGMRDVPTTFMVNVNCSSSCPKRLWRKCPGCVTWYGSPGRGRRCQLGYCDAVSLAPLV